MRLFKHDCPTPLRLPVVEEQRVWTCPDCGTPWRWDRTGENSIGWVRGEQPAQEKQSRTRLRIPDYTGPITSGWQYAPDFVPHHEGRPLPGWAPAARPDETQPWHWRLDRRRRIWSRWWRLQWW